MSWNEQFSQRYDDWSAYDVAGLEVETLQRNFDGSDLDANSREYVFVAKRP